MKIIALLSDDAILVEIGQRLARRRLDNDLTQAGLAKEAGISKRTLERIEAGESTQTLTMVRLLRVLSLMDELDQLVPETGLRPLTLLRNRGKEKKRASSRQKEHDKESDWSWGDDA